jgi:hypothetical protein
LPRVFFGGRERNRRSEVLRMILSRAGRFVVSTSSRRAFVSGACILYVSPDRHARSTPRTTPPSFPAAASPALRQQAAVSDANKDAKPIGPDNYEIAPTVIPWREYKNKYYEDRGFPLASKDHVVRFSSRSSVWCRPRHRFFCRRLFSSIGMDGFTCTFQQPWRQSKS